MAGVAGLAGGLAMLGGCVTSYVLIGARRAPVPMQQVRVYLHAPSGRYEEIAILDTSSRHSLSITAQGRTDAVINRLKAEAGRLGANGVLLEELGNQPSGAIGSALGASTAGGSLSLGIGIGASTTTFQKNGRGLAIYVATAKDAAP
jgi:hypothetical protein